jgi:hypothetical protein
VASSCRSLSALVLATVVAGALLAPARSSAADEYYKFPDRPSQPLPEFYPGGKKKPGSRATTSSAEATPLLPPGRLWYASGSVGVETVLWAMDPAAGNGAFPRYRTGAPPEYPTDTSRMLVAWYGYASVPSGSPPVFLALQGGLQPSPGWRLGLQYGFSRTAGPEIDVAHHALEVGTTLHPFQPRFFLHAGVGLDLLVFSDDVGADVYTRFATTLGAGVTLPFRANLTVPIALEGSRTLAPQEGSGLPAWYAVRLTAGLEFH